MLQKILVPLDGSELADRILAYVRRLLLCQDAEITLLHVLRRLPPPDYRDCGDLNAEEAKAHLERLQRGLAEQGARVRVAFMTGEPSEEILKFAEALRPTLLAMSTHGRTGLKRVLRGSVAEEVLRRSSFPLLLCNPHALPLRGARIEELRFERILVPVDGSAASWEVFPVVEELGRQFGAEVVLLYVAAVYPDPLGYPVATALPTSEEAARVAEDAAKRLDPAKVKTRTCVAFGLPETRIIQTAIAEGVDLVAMTTHGRTGFARFLLGSVAEAVLRASPCPVLMVRSGAIKADPSPSVRPHQL
jgi:nucleotide-binding universal stress UspA family protein